MADRLRASGLEPADIIAHRIRLHPADADGAYRETADLVRSRHALVYQRLQDGPAFGASALVAAFAEQGSGIERFLGLRQLVVRRAGSAPGDIVYDPEIAHLLHNFIARANDPTFYDAFDDGRGDALRDVVVRWPDGRDVRRADDAGLTIEAGN